MKALERTHILDEATRNRRQRKALEALEKDNFQDAPPTAAVSDYRLQLNKKFQQKFQLDNNDSLNNSLNTSVNDASVNNQNANNSVNTTSGNLNNTNLNESIAKKRKSKIESKAKFRKTFNALVEEEVKSER